MKGLVYVLGGTSEGRALVQALLERGYQVLLSVATSYGAALIEPRPGLEVLARQLNAAAMLALLKERQPFAVIDATHPYATQVTLACRMACGRACLPYLRLARPAAAKGNYIWAADYGEAVELLNQVKGPIFLTTGSKNLGDFTAVHDYQKRIALRILPMADSLNKALELGYAPQNIVCMQGPFSQELDAATFRKYRARYVVTKDSGEAGGFSAKARAAAQVGAKLVVISRQEEEDGSSLGEILEQVAELAPSTHI